MRVEIARPHLVVHADWSVRAAKRWMAKAVLQPDGRYQVFAPEPAGAPETLLRRLRQSIGPDGMLLAGFDFPIGLPVCYAQRCEIDDFLAFLTLLGEGDWGDFYRVAGQPDEIGLQRPFYPARPGNARQNDLLSALGFQAMNDLRRECELAHPGRRPAAPLFWTLGGQQVGKAAISGWRQVLAPALRQAGDSPSVAIWPFSGHLSDLLQPGATVLAETYPAEYYAPLGVKFSRQTGGKRSQAARQGGASALLEWAERARLGLAPELRTTLQDGFGPAPAGEDAFDAVVGLFGMLNLVLGLRPLEEPAGRRVLKIEGWILGQSCPVSELAQNPV
jgi:hypothetical protein